ERAEEAEETAEDIAAAVLQTELGRSIEAVRGELNAWRGEHDATHETLNGRLTALEAGMAEILARLPPPVIVAASSTPAPSAEAPIAETVTVATVEPESAPDVVENPVPATNKRRLKVI